MDEARAEHDCCAEPPRVPSAPMRLTWCLVGLLGGALSVLAGCGSSNSNGDAGADADARPRPDRLNLNCTSPAGDEAAANDVRLVLPETGVCSTDAAYSNAASEGCCGGPAPAGTDACCVDDATAKASGAAGCGVTEVKPIAAKSCCGSAQNA